MKSIYFFCPSNDKPTGGVKQIYRQVQMLNQMKYRAFLLLKKKEKRKNSWYSSGHTIYNYNIFFSVLESLGAKKKTIFNTIKKVFNKSNDTMIEPDAIIVMPEIYGKNMHKALGSRKYVIFNQNCFYTFQHYGFEYDKDNPYLNTNCLGVIVASDVAYEYLKYTFPNINIQKITLGIDDKVFHYSCDKKKKICYMPRKLSEDSEQIICILKAKSITEGWELCALDNLAEDEIAKHMKESAIFLSFNHREGFGLPPVEAMACGCCVIGYAGQAGIEYLDSEFSYPIPDGDVIAFVKTIKQVISLFNENATSILAKGKKASEFVLEKYSLDNEFATTKKAWENLLKN
ncbi:glycosyltransferase [Riemerella columbina]|uniref:glycosyltransferase n=1 Tax=Riemerella columbina TaxID=103810 RepID=UPI00037E5C8B|nr:glycosyltransferase [Riemerella columbina]